MKIYVKTGGEIHTTSCRTVKVEGEEAIELKKIPDNIFVASPTGGLRQAKPLYVQIIQNIINALHSLELEERGEVVAEIPCSVCGGQVIADAELYFFIQLKSQDGQRKIGDPMKLWLRRDCDLYSIRTIDGWQYAITQHLKYASGDGTKIHGTTDWELPLFGRARVEA